MKTLRFKRAGISLTLISGFLILTGCYTSSQITEFSDLNEAYYRQNRIRALAVDSSLYTLDLFSYDGSALYGEGYRVHRGAREDFKGKLGYSDILFLEQLRPNGWKAFWIVPMSVALAAGAATVTEPSHFEIWRASEGSCPYIYAFDGSEYRLEAEAFSTSISRALEAETFHVLPSLVPADGRLKIRVSNERPETHLFNSVRLFAVDAGRAKSVAADIGNNIWPVHNPAPPIAARDHSGREVLADLNASDGRYWRSDLKNNTPDTGFRDELQLQFDLPPGRSQATLVVEAINSELITEVYRTAGYLVGEEALAFYRALEEDPELKQYVREWIDKSSLTVELETESGWKKVGAIRPEANAIPFRRAVRLENLGNVKGPLTVRLSSLADVWRIDAVTIDTSPGGPLEMQSLELIAVKGPDGERNYKRAIAARDSLYAMILPPDHMDLSFDAAPANGMQNPRFVFAARGFLYEWFPSAKDNPGMHLLDGLQGMDRNRMLIYFMQREELLLGSIYGRWSGER